MTTPPALRMTVLASALVLLALPAGAQAPGPVAPPVAVAVAPAPPAQPTTRVPFESLEFEVFQLSYLQGDRALEFIQTLGYTIIGERIKVFKPRPDGTLESVPGPNLLLTELDPDDLPAVVQLPDSRTESVLAASIGGSTEGAGGVPNIGGHPMPFDTTGEPQQRLLIVYRPDEPDDVARTRKLLTLLREKIDLPSRQILIEALVVEVNRDHVRDLGFELQGGDGSFQYSFGQTVENLISPFSIAFDDTRDIVGAFSAKLFALIEQGDAEILSNPSVLVLDGRQARIQVGEQIPIIESNAVQGAVASSVSYFPVGIVLNLRPRLNQDGTEITMQVETIVSAINKEDEFKVDTSGPAIFAPRIDNRQVQSFVRVSNNTPFIIGGLISKEESRAVSRVPVLSRIPGLGRLFRHRGSQTETREVIIVLTPHVIPRSPKQFSRVIPSGSLFSRGNELFRDAYRISDTDVWDLEYLLQSEPLEKLRVVAEELSESPFVKESLRLLEVRDQLPAAVADERALEEASEAAPVPRKIRALPAEHDEAVRTVATLQRGGVPGEEVLIHRMLWEIATNIHEQGADRIDLRRALVFHPTPPACPSLRAPFEGTSTDVATLLALIKPPNNSLIIEFPQASLATGKNADRDKKTGLLARLELEPADVEVQPTAQVRCADLPGSAYFEALHKPEFAAIVLRRPQEEVSGYNKWTPENFLKALLVVKRILALNPDLPLTVDGFYPGRKIVFPNQEDFSERTHILDPKLAEVAMHVVDTNTAFRLRYNAKLKQVVMLRQYLNRMSRKEIVE